MTPFLLLTIGCRQDPMARELQGYQMRVDPIFVINLDLANRFEEIELKLKQKQIDANTAAAQLQGQLLPAAESLQVAVSAIQPAEPALQDAHQLLVSAWSHRAAAWRALSVAWAAGDGAGFDAALQKDLDARLEEEKYIRTINTLAEPWAIVFDPYAAQPLDAPAVPH